MAEVPVVVTGGDCAHGEVLRGEVLLVHYDEAETSETYARETLAAAAAAKAPAVVIDSLAEILEREHGGAASTEHPLVIRLRECLRAEDEGGCVDDTDVAIIAINAALSAGCAEGAAGSSGATTGASR